MTSAWRRALGRLGFAGPGERSACPGLAIELERCDGCGDCAAACAAEHGREPEGSWMRLLEARREGSSQPVTVPAPCLHCRPAPCLEACPTGASRQDAAGPPRVDEDACSGCGACAAACPIEAIVMERTAEGLRPGRCDLCAERLENDGADAQGSPEDERRQGLPACAAACTAGAITFGDLNAPDSPLADLHARPDAFALVAAARTRVRHLSGRR